MEKILYIYWYPIFRVRNSILSNREEKNIRGWIGALFYYLKKKNWRNLMFPDTFDSNNILQLV